MRNIEQKTINYNYNTTNIKNKYFAWDSNPGQQDGRHRRIHWAMAVPNLWTMFVPKWSSIVLYNSRVALARNMQRVKLYGRKLRLQNFLKNWSLECRFDANVSVVKRQMGTTLWRKVWSNFSANMLHCLHPKLTFCLKKLSQFINCLTDWRRTKNLKSTSLTKSSISRMRTS